MYKYLNLSSLLPFGREVDGHFVMEDKTFVFHPSEYDLKEDDDVLKVAREGCKCYAEAFYNTLSVIINKSTNKCYGNALIKGFNMLNDVKKRNMLLFMLPNIISKKAACCCSDYVSSETIEEVNVESEAVVHTQINNEWSDDEYEEDVGVGVDVFSEIGDRDYNDVLKRLLIGSKFVYGERRTLHTDRSVMSMLREYYTDVINPDGTGVYMFKPDIDDLIQRGIQFVYVYREKENHDYRLFRYESPNGWYAGCNLCDISETGWKRIEFHCKLIDGVDSVEVIGIKSLNHAEFVNDITSLNIDVKVNDLDERAGIHNCDSDYTIGVVDKEDITAAASKVIDIVKGGVVDIDKISIPKDTRVLCAPYGTIIYDLPDTLYSVKDDVGDKCYYATASKALTVTSANERRELYILVYKDYYNPKSPVSKAFVSCNFDSISKYLCGSASKNIYGTARSMMKGKKRHVGNSVAYIFTDPLLGISSGINECAYFSQKRKVKTEDEIDREIEAMKYEGRAIEENEDPEDEIKNYGKRNNSVGSKGKYEDGFHNVNYNNNRARRGRGRGNGNTNRRGARGRGTSGNVSRGGSAAKYAAKKVYQKKPS